MPCKRCNELNVKKTRYLASHKNVHVKNELASIKLIPLNYYWMASKVLLTSNVCKSGIFRKHFGCPTVHTKEHTHRDTSAR